MIPGNIPLILFQVQKLATIKKTTWTQKKLKKGVYYKYIIVAYRNTSEGQFIIASSKSIHTITKGNKKYTTAKSLKCSKSKVKLKRRKSYNLKVTEIAAEKKKRIQHHRNISYESSNTRIATVNSKGKISGKKKGSCKIYVFAQNGVYKVVNVKVQ